MLSEQLRELILPFVLRRTKQDVQKLEGIKKTDIVLWLKPTEEQVKFYKQVLENTAIIREAKTATTMGPTVFRAIGFLKKVCSAVAMCRPEFLASVMDEEEVAGGTPAPTSVVGTSFAAGVPAAGDKDKAKSSRAVFVANKKSKLAATAKGAAKGAAKDVRKGGGPNQGKKRASFGERTLGVVGAKAVSLLGNWGRALGGMLGGRGRKNNKAEEELLRQAQERRLMNRKRGAAEKAWARYMTELKESVEKELELAGTNSGDDVVVPASGVVPASVPASARIPPRQEEGGAPNSSSPGTHSQEVLEQVRLEGLVPKTNDTAASVGEDQSWWSGGALLPQWSPAGNKAASSSAAAPPPAPNDDQALQSVWSSMQSAHSVASSSAGSFPSHSPLGKNNHANSDLLGHSADVSRPSTAAQLCAQSAKLTFLRSFLPQLIKNGHRVLVFSSSTKVLDLIMVAVLKPLQIRCLRIDGTVDVGARNQKVGQIRCLRIDGTVDVGDRNQKV